MIDIENDEDCGNPCCQWCSWWREVTFCDGEPCRRVGAPGHAASARALGEGRDGVVMRSDPSEVLVRLFDGTGLVCAWTHTPYEPPIAVGDTVSVFAATNTLRHGSGLTSVLLLAPPDDDDTYWLAAAEVAVPAPVEVSGHLIGPVQ